MLDLDSLNGLPPLSTPLKADDLNLADAQAALEALASSFLQSPGHWLTPAAAAESNGSRKGEAPDYEVRYKALAEHIPAVIFVARWMPLMEKRTSARKLRRSLDSTRRSGWVIRCVGTARCIPTIGIAGVKKRQCFSRQGSRSDPPIG